MKIRYKISGKFEIDEIWKLSRVECAECDGERFISDFEFERPKQSTCWPVQGALFDASGRGFFYKIENLF